MSQIIGLLGASGAGKSEIAKYLVEHHGFVRMRFADGIKDMLKTLGMTDAQVDGSEKGDALPLLGGKNYRDAATSLGTGWGRTLMDEDLWVRALEQKLLAALLASGETKIVIDDVRYPNEMKMLARYQATFITVRRPSTEPVWNWWQRLCIRHGLYRLAGVHSSEVMYRQITTTNVLRNAGSLDDLHYLMERALAFIPDERLELP